MKRSYLQYLIIVILAFVSLSACSSADDPISDGDKDTDIDLSDGDLTDGDNESALEEEAEEEYDIIDETIKNVLAVERANNVLSCIVYFDTDVKTKAEVLIEDSNGKSWSAKKDDSYRTTHEIPVFYMYAETKYTFTVKVTDENGGRGSNSIEYTSSALPEDLPPIEVVVSNKEKMQAGLTLFNSWRWNPAVDISWGVLIAVDESGKIVWYYKASRLMFDVKMLSDGNIIYSYQNLGLAEISIMGEEGDDLLSDINGLTNFEVGTLHHDFIELPNGNLLAISAELRKIEYDDGEGGTVEYNVIGDIIHEMTRDGSVVKSWNLFDYLDPQRIRYGFEENFWDIVYRKSTKDWTHANGLIYDASDNSMIISVRHQDWLIKIDMDTDELVWKMGEEGDFTLQGDGEWMFHMHSPKFTQNGNILLYDNGNARSSYAPGDTPYSRVAQFSYDETAKTVTQEWEYRGEDPYFVPFVGNVDELANGNILITDGAIIENPLVDEYELDNQKHTRIVEITPGDNPEKVFEIIIKDKSADKTGYLVYRANRLPALSK